MTFFKIKIKKLENIIHHVPFSLGAFNFHSFFLTNRIKDDLNSVSAFPYYDKLIS
jgi:hypothetical protein